MSASDANAVDRLPVHGFVLAGGKSMRMGRDKALLQFAGAAMVEIAVGKLRTFCAEVSLAGDRNDLEHLAPVVVEERRETGPAAGMEAGLGASFEAWAMFLPVDVPLVPEALLRGWAEAVLGQEGSGTRLSYLRVQGQRHPAIAMLHRDCKDALQRVLDEGERKLESVFARTAESLGAGSLWVAEAEAFVGTKDATNQDMEAWFGNVNTPEDKAALELWVRRSAPALALHGR